MKENAQFKRRNVFIKKRFQTDFAVRFLVLIIIESILAIGLFVYLSRDTVITGYSGTELIIADTGEYFLPTLVLTNLIVIGLTAVAGFAVMVYLSHKIAGPFYRFERSLEELGDGDLTHRFSLREGDQMDIIADRINEMGARFDEAIARVKTDTRWLKEALNKLDAALKNGASPDQTARLLDETGKRLQELEKSESWFTTKADK